MKKLLLLLLLCHNFCNGQKAYVELTMLKDVLLYETNAGGHVIDELKEGSKVFGFSIIDGVDQFSSYKFWHVSTLTKIGYIIESKEKFNYSRNAFIYSNSDEGDVDKLRDWAAIGDADRLIETLKMKMKKSVQSTDSIQTLSDDIMPHSISVDIRNQHEIDSLNSYFPQKVKHKYICPVEIQESYISENVIGEPVASIRYINISEKTIDAIDINMYCYDNFNEKVNRIGGDNIFNGISQDELQSGYEQTAEWTLHLYENTKKIKPKIIRVHFTDGSVWPQKVKNK